MVLTPNLLSASQALLRLAEEESHHWPAQLGYLLVEETIELCDCPGHSTRQDIQSR